MAGNLPPGCTQQMCDEAQPGYWDEPPAERDDEDIRFCTETALSKASRFDAIASTIENDPKWFESQNLEDDDLIEALQIAAVTLRRTENAV